MIIKLIMQAIGIWKILKDVRKKNTPIISQGGVNVLNIVIHFLIDFSMHMF